jgi:hypothetical protein
LPSGKDSSLEYGKVIPKVVALRRLDPRVLADQECLLERSEALKESGIKNARQGGNSGVMLDADDYIMGGWQSVNSSKLVNDSIWG